MTAEREDVDRRIRALVATDVDGAAALAITEYGPELHAFLGALARDTTLSDEAFAATCEQLWRGLAGFRWEASLRTWAYQIARNTLHRLRRDPRDRPERNLPLSIITSMAAIARTPTAPFQRTDVKSKLRAMIEALDPDDHELVILRLDRGLAWKDIARATSDDAPTDEVLARRAATCRKRYERIKEQLRIGAAERGLLGD